MTSITYGVKALEAMGKRISFYRTMQGITAAKLAKLIGVPALFMKRLEKGRIMNPSVLTIMSIGVFLERTPGELLHQAQAVIDKAEEEDYRKFCLEQKKDLRLEKPPRKRKLTKRDEKQLAPFRTKPNPLGMFRRFD